MTGRLRICNEDSIFKPTNAKTVMPKVKPDTNAAEILKALQEGAEDRA